MNLNFAIALSGGIASGKSTIGSLLSLKGFKIIDLDKITHNLLSLHVNKIKNLFGDEYVNGSHVNKDKLAKLIFNDPKQKQKLEDFLHPLIRKECESEALKLEKFKVPYFIDIPLFFEKQEFYPLKYSVLIYAPKQTQIQRLMNRQNLNEKEAIIRINNQMDIENKKNLASFVVDNSQDLGHLQDEVERLIVWIKERYENLKI